MARRLFYGWVITGAAALGIASSFSVLVVTITPIFSRPLAAEMGWSLSQIYLGPLVAGICGLLTAPFIGALADRAGARRIVLISFVMEVLLLASFRYLTPAIFGYWLRYALLAFLCMGTTQIVFGRIVSAWFSRRLGLALGIALAGVGVGGYIWSLLLQKLIDLYGWRDTYLALAMLIGAVTLPLLWLLLRDTPASVGMQVDGAGAPAAPSTTGESGTRLLEAVRSRQYQLMAVTYFLLGLSLQGAQLHVIPLLESHGMPAQLAAAAQGYMLATVIVGRVTSGLLLDHLFAPRVAQGFLLAPILGICALTLGASGGAAVLAAMGIGLAVGGESDVIAYLVRRYWGLREYGRIYGTFFSFFGAGSAIGPALTAWGVAHVHGGYSRVLWVHVGVLVLAVCLMFGFKTYRRE
jgi:MFS family permease